MNMMHPMGIYMKKNYNWISSNDFYNYGSEIMVFWEGSWETETNSKMNVRGLLIVSEGKLNNA